MKNPRKKPSKASKSSQKQANSDSLYDLMGPIVYTYTRAQAIADGVQLDVSAAALEVGIHCPVYITASIYAVCVVGYGKALGLSERTSLKRFLETVQMAISLWDKPRITFLYVLADGSDRREKVIIARCTQDITNWVPAITLMAPGED